MSLQLECNYLKRTVPRVGTLVGPIEEALREKFFSTLFGGEEINANFHKILGHIVKHGNLGIPNTRFSTDSAYNTPNVPSGGLLGSLLGGASLNYIGNTS